MDEEYTLFVKNKRLYEFYSSNPNLNFEAMNLLFMGFIEQLNSDLTKTLQNTIQNEILQSMRKLQGDIVYMNQNVTNQNNAIIVKFHDINKEFLDNMKLMIENSMNNNSDKLSVNLDKTTDVFVSKLNSILPMNNDMLNKEFKNLMKESQDHISELLKSQNPNKVEEYLKTMDQRLKFAQEPIIQYMKLNNEQIKTQYNSIRDTTLVSQASQDKIFNELNEFLNKCKSSSSLKGQYSENILESILNKLYPMGSVIHTSSLKATGDFILRRNNKKQVLIENKNYEGNVSNEEVKKFLRDIREQNCNGLFLSHFSGIVNKPNYFIEIHDGNVLVYLHNVEYDPEKIRTGIDIMDHLSDKLKDFYLNENNGFTIDKEILDGINAEYQSFLTNKESMITTVRDFQKKMVSQIEELKMPDLHNYLCGKYACQINDFVCEVCGESFAKKNALASHSKKHKNK
jgi:hypothetical protein